MRLHGRFQSIRTGTQDVDAALERWRVALELLAGSTWDGNTSVAAHDHSQFLTRDGSRLLDAAYEPTEDQGIATKAYVDDTVGGSGYATTGYVDDADALLVALAGRLGGQTIHGGTGAGQGLTLQSTSDSSRGVVSVVDDLVAQTRLRVGVSTADQITSDQNDYPCGGRGVLLLATDASRTLTGLDGAGDSQFLLIVNVGSQDLILAHESSSSAAENRIVTGPAGSSLTVPAAGNVTLWYDANSARWRVTAVRV